MRPFGCHLGRDVSGERATGRYKVLDGLYEQRNIAAWGVVERRPGQTTPDGLIFGEIHEKTGKTFDIVRFDDVSVDPVPDQFIPRAACFGDDRRLRGQRRRIPPSDW